MPNDARPADLEAAPGADGPVALPDPARVRANADFEAARARHAERKAAAAAAEPDKMSQVMR